VEARVVPSPDVLLDRLAPQPTLFIGDGTRTYRDSIQQRMSGAGAVAAISTPLLAGTIAIMASGVAAEGVSAPPHAIRPLYVRRTEAELARDPRAVYSHSR